MAYHQSLTRRSKPRPKLTVSKQLPEKHLRPLICLLAKNISRLKIKPKDQTHSRMKTLVPKVCLTLLAKNGKTKWTELSHLDWTATKEERRAGTIASYNLVTLKLKATNFCSFMETLSKFSTIKSFRKPWYRSHSNMSDLITSSVPRIFLSSRDS